MRGGDGETVFDLFASTGYLGELRVLGDVETFHVGVEHFVTVELDELGIPSVRIWRLSG